MDAGTSGDGFIDEGVIVLSCSDGHFILRHEGADDSLGGLLCEAKAFDLEAGVSKNGGDEIAAGDFSGAGSCAGAVEVPWRSEPAAHHGGEHDFEGGLASGDNG